MVVYRYPGSRIRFISLLLGIPVAAFLILFWQSSSYDLAAKTNISLLVIIPNLVTILALISSRVEVDEHAIRTKGLFSSTIFPWDQVDDVVSVDAFTVIKSSRLDSSLKVLHPLPDNPLQQLLALENHLELRDTIIKHCLPHLKRIWMDERDRAYRYPSYSLLRHAIYLAPVLAILLANFGRGIYDQKLNIDRLMLTINLSLIFCPFSFFLYFKSRYFFGRRKIVVNNRSITFESSRKKIEMQWNELEQVSLPEPDGFSKLVNFLGFAILHKHGGEQVVVPLGMERFCDFLYQVKKHTSLKINLPITGLRETPWATVPR